MLLCCLLGLVQSVAVVAHFVVFVLCLLGLYSNYGAGTQVSLLAVGRIVACYFHTYFIVSAPEITHCCGIKIPKSQCCQAHAKYM